MPLLLHSLLPFSVSLIALLIATGFRVELLVSVGLTLDVLLVDVVLVELLTSLTDVGVDALSYVLLAVPVVPVPVVLHLAVNSVFISTCSLR